MEAKKNKNKSEKKSDLKQEDNFNFDKKNDPKKDVTKKDEGSKPKKNSPINIEEKILELSEEIKSLEYKNLELGQEILKSSLYIKRYIKMRRIFAGIKWALFLLILILGFLSMNFIFDYLQNILNSYQDQINQIVEQTNNVRR